MGATGQRRLERLFRAIIVGRWWIVAVYALLVPLAAWFATGVKQYDSLDRLIVQSDPDFVATKAFERVFGSGEYAILLAEAPDPFAPQALARFDEIERALGALPRVETSSALSIYRRTQSRYEA